ncbi:MAG: cation:proton antiporter, partial [Chloroflexota bacterium]|nr:cation:proton antiporter [Chloroflexota bacterium]
PTLLLAVIVIFVARPVAFAIVLRRARISRTARAFLGWFGPRGLNSLLFALLLVRDGVPEAERLMALVGMVVIVSVVTHGVSASPLSALYARRAQESTLDEKREGSAAGLFQGTADGVARITPEELDALLSSSQAPVVLDVRSRSQYERAEGQIPGSIRVATDEIAEWTKGREKDRLVVAYCT